MNSYEVYEGMLKMFGTIPDPNHQPQKFKFLLDSYIFLTNRDK